MLDVGLLILRVVVGVLLVGHGLQKLTRWFGGQGRAAHGAYLEQLGYRWGKSLAVAHGLAELAAGALIAAGLWMPLAAALVIAVMLNAAVAVHAPNGLWVTNGGYEYPLVLAAIAAMLAFTGAGVYAVDAAIGWQATTGWALGGLIAGIVLGALVLALRVRPTEQTVPRSHDDGLRAA